MTSSDPVRATGVEAVRRALIPPLPEPCINGPCRSRHACDGFGYCRDRNAADGPPHWTTPELVKLRRAECQQRRRASTEEPRP